MGHAGLLDWRVNDDITHSSICNLGREREAGLGGTWRLLRESRRNEQEQQTDTCWNDEGLFLFLIFLACVSPLAFRGRSARPCWVGWGVYSGTERPCGLGC